MSNDLFLLLSAPWTICFENQPEGEELENEPEVVDPPADPPAQDKKERLFTQKEVDEFVVKRQKAVQRQLKQMEENIQSLLQEKNLSEEQRGKFEEQLEIVQAQQRTKEEQLRQDQKKAADKHAKEMEKVTGERNRYELLFRESTIKRAISDAATRHEGFDPEQFIALLAPKTKLVENDGEFSPMVEIIGKDEDTGEPALMLKTPDEAISSMKEQDKYANLFRPNISRGVGGTNSTSGGSGSINARKLSTEEYMRVRKEKGRAALGVAR